MVHVPGAGSSHCVLNGQLYVHSVPGCAYNESYEMAVSSLRYRFTGHMSLRRILGWQKGFMVMASLRALHGSSKSSPGLERVPCITLAGTTRGSAAPGCAGHKDRDGKHNPTPHPRSPPLQLVYLRSRLGSRGWATSGVLLVPTPQIGRKTGRILTGLGRTAVGVAVAP